MAPTCEKSLNPLRAKKKKRKKGKNTFKSNFITKTWTSQRKWNSFPLVFILKQNKDWLLKVYFFDSIHKSDNHKRNVFSFEFIYKIDSTEFKIDFSYIKMKMMIFRDETAQKTSYFNSFSLFPFTNCLAMRNLSVTEWANDKKKQNQLNEKKI